MRLGFIILTLIFLSSCASNPQSLNKVIIGKWQLSKFYVQDASLQEELKESAKDLAETVQYLFLEDGSYTITSSSIEKGKRGIWVFRQETNDLVLELQNEAPSVIRVLEIEPNLLRCESPTSATGKVNFELIRLTK